MAGLGKRRPQRPRSGMSGLSSRSAKAAPRPEAMDGALIMIDGLAHDGRGLARDGEGKTLFVEGALPGERVEIAIHRTRKRFDEAHVRKVVDASGSRVEAVCRHFGRCGGCDLQHLSLDGQRRHKIEVLRNLLERQGVQLEGETQLLASEGEGYRRRARLGLRVDAEGEVQLGFRARHSHRLVDLDVCPVLVPALASLLPALRAQVAGLDAPRQVGHVELLASDDGGVSLVIRQLRDHAGDRERWRRFAQANGLNLGQWLGREDPELVWLTAEPALSCRLTVGGRSLDLKVLPGDFLQANAAVNQRMVATAMEWLSPLRGAPRVLDLFAGIGNFSLPLAASGADVTAVEGSAAMVERLAGNAAANGLTLQARCADLNAEASCAGLLREHQPDVVLLDPPRSGADTLCRQLAERPVPRVLYISCDPATLARDAARLVAAGYVVRRSAVADMFAHTSHLESMLLLEQPDSRRRCQGESSDG